MSNIIESISTGVSSVCSKLKRNVPVVVGVYFAVVIAHFACSNLYPTLCCNMSVWGFVMSPFMAVTPHCEALRWVIHYTGGQIRNVWIWLGGYLVLYFGNIITPFILNFRNISTRTLVEGTENEPVIEGTTNEPVIDGTANEPVVEGNGNDGLSKRKTRSRE
jgi:hypothetical protein